MPLDKIEVARRQLGTALALYLQDQDPVSVHVLASGACEIVDHLAEQAGGQSFRIHAESTFPDLKPDHVKWLRNRYWNAFKHALGFDRRSRREDSELFARFSDAKNDHSLLVGWSDYFQAARLLPVEAQAFQVFYFAKFPEKLAPNVPRDKYFAAFPEINTVPRSEQKRRLREIIEAYRPALLDDPRTDPRPLILPADLG